MVLVLVEVVGVDWLVVGLGEHELVVVVIG